MVGKLGRSARRELVRPKTARSAGPKFSTEFNESVLLDEAEVLLSGDARLTVMDIADDASSLGAIAPTGAARSTAGVEAVKCFVQGWLS